MVVGARKSEVDERLSPRSCPRQPAVHRPPRQPVRPQFQRHLLGLPGLLAPLRQVLPGPLAGLRDRDRDQRPRTRARHARRRGRNRLRRPPGRLAFEALHLARRLADPEDHRPPLPDRAPGPLLRQLRLFLAALAVVLAVPLAITFFETGLVPRFPTAILVTGLMILAFLSFFTGLILDTVVRGRREVRRLHYLSLPAPGAPQM